MLPHSLASEPPQGWSVWKVFAWAAETTFSWISSVLISPNGKKERKKRSVSSKELISSFLWRKRQTVMSKQHARWFKQLSSGLQGKTQQFPVLLLLCLKGKKGKQNKENTSAALPACHARVNVRTEKSPANIHSS